MSIKVRVVYEDSRKGAEPFGLHELLLACVADETGESVWDLGRQVEANPRNSNSQVLKSLGSPDGAWIVAVLDSDKIRTQPAVEAALQAAHVQSTTQADWGDVVRAIGTLPGASDLLAVVLLVDNAESVIEAIAQCVPDIDPAVLSRARRKKLKDRDIVMRKAAYSPQRAVRDCVLGRVPSLALLRDRIRCAMVDPI